jgi:pimeloyl-ACP methyl ester carboxylesterase
VLIINSKQGYPHRIGQAGTLEHFGDIRLIEIDEAGHWTHHDQLDDFVELVTDFLGG